MQNTNISSTTTLSDASQVRYQKAVREISKLTALNNTLKRDADGFRHMCENLQMQNRQVFQGFQEATKEKKVLEEKVKGLQAKIKEIETTNEGLSKNQQNLYSEKMIQEETKKFKQEITALHDKLNEQGNAQIELQEKLAQLHKENIDLKAKNQKLQLTIQQQIQQQKKTVPVENCPKCPEILERMRKTQDYCNNLKEQYFNLMKNKTLQQIHHEKQSYLVDRPKTSLLYYQKLQNQLQQKIRIERQRNVRLQTENQKINKTLRKKQHQIKDYKQKLQSYQNNLNK